MHRFIRSLVPAEWRETVTRDLEEEARAGGHGRLWLLWHTLRVAVHLRSSVRLDIVLSDIRYAVRSLVHAKWFTLGAALTFAIGIGVNTAMFAVVDRVLFRPLPFRDVDQLVTAFPYSPKSGQRYSYFPKSIAVEARQRATALESIAYAGTADRFAFAGANQPPLLLTGASVNVLDVLGVAPAAGRGFTSSDVDAKHQVALLRHEVWHGRFGASDSVFGKTVTYGTQSADIVGVLPPNFVVPAVNFTAGTDGLVLDLESLDSAGPRDLIPGLFMRLRQGATIDQARQQFEAIIAALQPDKAPDERDALAIQPLREGVFWRYHQSLRLLFAGASLVWLLGCVNLGTLILARGRSRQAETAVRTALGASQARILASVLIESLLICGTGAALVVAVLAWSMKGLSTIIPGYFQSMILTSLDWRVVAFSLVGASAGALIAGIYPAWRACRVDASRMLVNVSRSGRQRTGRSVLVVQSAIGTTLVIVAALCMRSLIGLLSTDLGYEPRGLYAVSGSVGGPRPATTQEGFTRLQQLREFIEVQPGVQRATIAWQTPFGMEAPDQAVDDHGHSYSGRRILADYFTVLETPILAGRAFTESEVQSAAPVAIVSRGVAGRCWPGATPSQLIGRTIQLVDQPARHIVGVVADTRRTYGSDVAAEVFFPAQPGDRGGRGLIARAVRGTTLDGKGLKLRLQQTFGGGATVAVYPVTQYLDPVLEDPKLYAWIFMAFAAIALILSSVGLFAVASGDASLRRQEMGIRIALGATRSELRRLVVFDAIRPVMYGVVVGAVGAYWAGALVQSMLQHVDARDPWTYAIVGVVLLATGVVASWIPALRASRTDPVTTLRVS